MTNNVAKVTHLRLGKGAFLRLDCQPSLMYEPEYKMFHMLPSGGTVDYNVMPLPSSMG